jgi:hypothetical protein
LISILLFIILIYTSVLTYLTKNPEAVHGRVLQTDSMVISDALFDFAKKLCIATGSHVQSENIPTNPSLYAQASIDGSLCWKIVSQVLLDCV